MNITGGKYNSIKVKAPDTDKVRPTLSKIRESIFNMLAAKFDFENANFLDVFSGSGIMSLEAVSRGFKNVVSIEKDYKTAKIIKENFSHIGVNPNLIIKDAIKTLDNINDCFEVIFLDPPYQNIDLYNKTLKKIIENNILAQNGIIIVESQKGLIYEVPKELELIKEKIYGDTQIKFYVISDKEKRTK